MFFKSLLKKISFAKEANKIAQAFCRDGYFFVIKNLRTFSKSKIPFLFYHIKSSKPLIPVEQAFCNVLPSLGKINPFYLEFARFLSYRDDLFDEKIGACLKDFFNQKMDTQEKKQDFVIVARSEKAQEQYEQAILFIAQVVGQEKNPLKFAILNALADFQHVMEFETDFRFKAAEITEINELLIDIGCDNNSEIVWEKTSKNELAFCLCNNRKNAVDLPRALFEIIARPRILLIGLEDAELQDLSDVFFYKIDREAHRHLGKVLHALLVDNYDDLVRYYGLFRDKKEQLEIKISEIKTRYLQGEFSVSSALKGYIEELINLDVKKDLYDLYVLQNTLESYEILLKRNGYERGFFSSENMNKALAEWSDYFVINSVFPDKAMTCSHEKQKVLDKNDFSYFKGLSDKEGTKRKGNRALSLIVWGVLMYIVFSLLR